MTAIKVGRLTSGGYSVAFGKQIGMGYVRPDLAAAGHAAEGPDAAPALGRGGDRGQPLRPARTLRLVWSRTVTEADMAADPSLAPVCLRPRAIGPMMPQRDLFVAGDHRLLIPGYRLTDQPDTAAALISAREIAGTSDAAFVHRNGSDITFYNLVFDTHEVFTANGMPVESFLITDDSLEVVSPDVRARIGAALPEVACKAEAHRALGYPVAGRDSYLPEYA
jgi:hypothetical protein